MKLNPGILSILLFFLVFCVWGQEFPHVSDINVEVRNNLIRLTWVDSPEARGPVYIFRSARPFSTAVPANIRPILVRYGVQSYIDDTDDLGNVYYFIAASDTAGRRYDVIISQVNSANVHLAHQDESDKPDEPTSLPVIALPEPALTEGLSNLNTVLDGERVTITFRNTDPKRNALLYRSSRPIRRPHDLINASIVQQGILSADAPGANLQFTDYPVPGHTWYYALIYEDEVTSGNITINPGINTTTTAVIVSSDLGASRYMRPVPLPELTLSDIQGGFLSNHTRNMPLGSASLEILRNTPLMPREPLALKRPRVFIVDLQSPAGGEESALFQIIKDHFETFEWESASEQLRHFLSLPRSREVEARARFYLGQSLYFTGHYREALMEFLSFRSYHQTEANIWIDAVLTAMVE